MFELFELMRVPTVLMAPDEGGGAAPGAPSSSAPEGGSGEAAPPASAPTSPGSGSGDSGGGVKESVPASGGLQDSAEKDEGDFTIPDLGGEDLDEIILQTEAPTDPKTPDAPAAQPPKDVVPAEPPKTPGQEEPKTAVTQEAPQQQPPTPAQQQPDGQAQPQPQGMPDNPQGLTDLLVSQKDQVIQQLADSYYKLSEKEVEALQEDAITEMPKLLAKVHHAVLSASLQHLATLGPRMIQTHSKVTAASTKAKDAFFKAHPELNEEAHGKAVATIARVYRAQNPNAPLEDIIRDVGTMVKAQSGLTSATPPPVPNGQDKNPPPFVPAKGGGGGTPPTKPAPDPFGGLGMDFD